MNADKFIEIHMRNNAEAVQQYIDTYEGSRCHNYLLNIFHSTPYLSDVVRLIQAKEAGIEGELAQWNSQMDFDKDAIYSALKKYHK